MQKEYKWLKVVSPISLFVLAPIFAFICCKVFDPKYYYISATVIIVLAILPFFVMFEKRKLSTIELVTVAVMVAVCSGSRLAFSFLPQFKPMCALVIIAASAFGENIGFIVGAMSVFVSNFAFGQGAFTPFQMLGMGLVAFLCGALFHNKILGKNRLAVSVIGTVLTFFVYGVIVDSASVFMMTTEYTFEKIIGIYASGVGFNLIHAITTGIVLFLFYKPMINKLSRLNVKYGIFAFSADWR